MPEHDEAYYQRQFTDRAAQETPPPPHVHERLFDGDDPYLVCECGARWNALSGAPMNDLAVTK